jgi:hypothetical protein
MSTTGLKPKQVLQRLLEKYPAANEAEPISSEALMTALAGLVHTEETRQPLLERLQPTEELNAERLRPGPRQAALLAWVDQAFRLMLSEHPLDDELSTRIKKLLPLVACVAQLEGEFLSIGQHPLQRLIDSIYIAGVGWHSRLGRSGSALLAELDKIAVSALQYFEFPDIDFASMLVEFENFVDGESSAAARMRERVIASESGKMKAGAARITAGEALNELMEDGHFSEAVTEFLLGPWYDSMQLILITSGPDSPEWERMLKVSKTLVWTVQPFDGCEDTERQRLYKLIPLLPRELEGLLASLEHDPAERKQAIAIIEDMHFRLLRNRPPKFKPFEPLLLNAAHARTSVTEPMLAQIKSLQAGQWFKISSEDGPNLRVQLALKMDEFHQLLFVSRAGIKALQKTFEEFAYLLSSGVAAPCGEAPAMTVSLLKALDMEAEADAARAQRTSAGERAAGKRNLSPRVKELKEERARQRLATETAGTEIPPLTIGNWVKFSDEEEVQLCKLAVRIEGSDKWLFVNNRGAKQRELDSEVLSALFSAGHCELVNSESRFEQTVASMVRDFRDPKDEEA